MMFFRIISLTQKPTALESRTHNKNSFRDLSQLFQFNGFLFRFVRINTFFQRMAASAQEVNALHFIEDLNGFTLGRKSKCICILLVLQLC